MTPQTITVNLDVARLTRSVRHSPDIAIFLARVAEGEDASTCCMDMIEAILLDGLNAHIDLIKVAIGGGGVPGVSIVSSVVEVRDK